jgi:hypothetical protein
MRVDDKGARRASEICMRTGGVGWQQHNLSASKSLGSEQGSNMHSYHCHACLACRERVGYQVVCPLSVVRRAGLCGTTYPRLNATQLSGYSLPCPCLCFAKSDLDPALWAQRWPESFGPISEGGWLVGLWVNYMHVT